MNNETTKKPIYEKNYEYIVAMGISTGGPKLLSELIKT